MAHQPANKYPAGAELQAAAIADGVLQRTGLFGAKRCLGYGKGMQVTTGALLAPGRLLCKVLTAVGQQ